MVNTAAPLECEAKALQKVQSSHRVGSAMEQQTRPPGEETEAKKPTTISAVQSCRYHSQRSGCFVLHGKFGKLNCCSGLKVHLRHG